MSFPIATIISYCTNDFRFIGKCIEEAQKFSSEVLVVVCDHFFDGSEENRFLLEHTYAGNARFIEFAYSEKLYSPYHKIEPYSENWSIFWAATTRYIGAHYVDQEYLLFLDSDEIVDAEAFSKWLETGEYRNYEAMRLAAYLYAIEPRLRAKKVVNLPFLVKKKGFSPLSLVNELERIGAYQVHGGPKREAVVGLEGRPFVHHYSWVRTKEECYQKTRTWGHKHDANWPLLIEEAFSGKREHIFDTNHEFINIENPFFDPFSILFPVGPALKRGAVLKITAQDLFRKTVDEIL